MPAVGGRGGGANGELVGRGFESEEGTRSRFLPGVGGSFGADSEELAVLGQTAIGGIEMRFNSWVRGMEGLAPSLERARRKDLGLSILSLISVSRDMRRRLQEAGEERKSRGNGSTHTASVCKERCCHGPSIRSGKIVRFSSWDDRLALPDRWRNSTAEGMAASKGRRGKVTLRGGAEAR